MEDAEYRADFMSASSSTGSSNLSEEVEMMEAEKAKAKELSESSSDDADMQNAEMKDGLLERYRWLGDEAWMSTEP